MKIISLSAIKGGVGKTTLAFNFGEWLASKGKKVLFIDLDHQCNLTQTYNVYTADNTVRGFFTDEEDVNIIEVKPNIHLIAGYMYLDSIEKALENKVNKDMLLYMWLSDHFESKQLDQYDTIIIDCHPDFSTATRNAIAVSHAIISPIIPSEHGYNAKFNLEERLEAYRKEVINYQTRESYITAQLYFIANMIKHNTNSSRELLSLLEGNDTVLAQVPVKELFNRSTLDKKSISEMALDQKLYQVHKSFFDNIEVTFQSIYDRLYL
ncbi:AAA family ATPase [Streptococcus canis]|uniref:ParA family protein n=1 Tax=Streptococcus canis TaxID=1329 RepID=UPI002949127D|nr:AAA family ATPase [Streptococcus canis]MDV6001641.1 AAA family ATPase [Streptococcus canis]